jgi:hypothetical protein
VPPPRAHPSSLAGVIAAEPSPSLRSPPWQPNHSSTPTKSPSSPSSHVWASTTGLPTGIITAEAAGAEHRRAHSPAPCPPTSGHKSAHRKPLTFLHPSPTLPGALLTGIWPKPPPAMPQGPHCKPERISRVFCANQGHICKESKVPRDLGVKLILNSISRVTETCEMHRNL